MFYHTLLKAAEEEILPMLGEEAGADTVEELNEVFDVEGLAAEVFTVDPVSGMLTHTGAGITDEMLERHVR